MKKKKKNTKNNTWYVFNSAMGTNVKGFKKWILGSFPMTLKVLKETRSPLINLPPGFGIAQLSTITYTQGVYACMRAPDALTSGY